MHVWSNPLTYLILLALAVAASAYGWGYVRPLRRRDAQHGQTALLVVMGDGLVALAAILIVAANGPVDALALAAILTASLIAGGLPMIVEYVDDHTQQRQAQRQRSDAADLNRLLAEEE